MIKIISLIGFLLSLYAYYIERKFNINKNYKAVCDLNEKVSCTKAFSSIYGKMFGISNSLAGLGFYVLIFILSFYNLNYVFYLASLSLLSSIYLAYASFFKLKNFCFICLGIYLVNILLFIFSWFFITT